MPKIEVDKEKCTGCNLCAVTCSDTFEMDGDKAVVKKSEVDEITCEKDAADSCPVGAIKISE